MIKTFYELREKASILDIFKNLYPDNKIIEEINPKTGIKLYKTFSPFLNSNSKLEQLYLSELSVYGPGYFDFDTGKRGFIPNLLVEYFQEENSLHQIKKYEKSLNYLFEKFNLTLNKKEEKTFLKEFEEIYLRGFDFYYISIFEQSLLANNSTPLKDGSWVNYYTDKWEGWNQID